MKGPRTLSPFGRTILASIVIWALVIGAFVLMAGIK